MLSKKNGFTDGVATSGNLLYQNSKISLNYFSHSSYYFTAPSLTRSIKNQNINIRYNNRTTVTNHHWISLNNRASGLSHIVDMSGIFAFSVLL